MQVSAEDETTTAGPRRAEWPPGVAVVVVLDALSQGAGLRPPEDEVHTHDEHILAWSDTATVVISCEQREWVVSPGHGMWVPAGTPHAVQVVRAGAGNALIFHPDRCPLAWPEPAAVVISPLLRELVLRLDRLGGTEPEVRQRVEAVLFDVIEPVPATTIPLPIPKDDRLRGITDALMKDPADDRDLAQWAFDVGAGARTISRLFVVETGMTFAQWRTRARIHAAISLLAAGTPVGTAGRRVGFTKPAAFSEAFRRVTGHSPSAVATPGVRAGAPPSSVQVRAGR